MSLSQEEASFRRYSQRNLQKRNPADKIQIEGILKNISAPRVNVIGTVVLKQDSANYQTVVLDDGRSKIAARNFNNIPSFSNFDVGESVAIIGNPREFNGEIYIAAEIIKKVNPLWMKVRNIESESSYGCAKKDLQHNKDILSIIRELDEGKGVPIERVLEACGAEDTKLKVDLLLKKGDLFEVSPGKLKVLE